MIRSSIYSTTRLTDLPSAEIMERPVRSDRGITFIHTRVTR